MTGLRVLDPGMQTTVQDRGRLGWEHLGVARGGALDFAAFRWANRLAGNKEDLAVLESVLAGPTVLALRDTWLGVTGAGDVTVDGRPLPPWSGFRAPSGSTVKIQGLSGARCYLAARGGIEVSPVLGSRSTDLTAGFGGFRGRALQAGDELSVGANTISPAEAGEILYCPSPEINLPPFLVRVVAGPGLERLPANAFSALQAGRYTASPQSSAMGIRLVGPSLPSTSGSEISQPMPVGGIQITPSGQPIVLLNARGTIGGYPVVATAITPDVWRLGQVRPGDQVRFESISIAEARALTITSFVRLAAATPLRSTMDVER